MIKTGLLIRNPQETGTVIKVQPSSREQETCKNKKIKELE